MLQLGFKSRPLTLKLNHEALLPPNYLLIYRDSMQYDPLSPQELSQTFFWPDSCRYWDLKSGACTRIFSGHQGTITCIDLCKNRLVSGGKDCQVKGEKEVP